MTYWEALMEVIRRAPSNIFDRELAAHLWWGVVAVLLWFVRLAIVAVFPISFPIIAYYMKRDADKREASMDAARARFVANLHKATQEMQ